MLSVETDHGVAIREVQSPGRALGAAGEHLRAVARR